MRVNYTHLISAGFFVYATVFMLWSLMTTYDLAYGVNAQFVSYAVTALAAFLAARFTAATNANAWLYGALWTIVYIALDVVFVVPVAGFESLLTSFNFISYGVVLFVPIILAAATELITPRRVI